MNKNCLVYVTVKDEKEGTYISKLVVEKKLAVCANLFPNVKSIFRWKKDILVEGESVLIFKTSDKKYSELEKFISKNHSYNSPCILKLPIKKGEKNFMQWIEDSLK